jgi:hypothetical protein
MTNKLPQRDPEAAWVRKVVAERSVGVNARCACGENRPKALIKGSKPIMCHECKRKKEGKITMDNHHFAGKANSPITIQVPANDHCAELNVAQYDWPKQALENPDGSPLLAAAGCIRGFIDYILYLIEKGLRWIADMLEAADAFLGKQLGSKWWVGTELEKFAPEQKSKSHRESR